MGTNTLLEHTFPCTSRRLGSAPHFILALVVGADVRDSPPRPPTPPFPGQHLREQLAETTAELNSLKALLAAAVPQPQLESTHPETAKRPKPSNLLISKQDRVTIPGTWVPNGYSRPPSQVRIWGKVEVNLRIYSRVLSPRHGIRCGRGRRSLQRRGRRLTE